MIDNLRRSIVVLICIWTMMLLVIYGTIVYLHYLDTIKETVNEARHYHTLNLHYRAWNANLGGVYADAAKVEPNPHLTVPKRDVTLPDGTKYTLINPSYMTRMVFDTIRNSADNQIVSKLTSLKYLNPDNAPDQWESEALKQFERGSIKEKFERTVIGDKPYLRFISPFITDSSCLKCHAHQGYKAGDIRGGISIAVPLENHLSFVVSTSINLAIAFFILWSLGVLGMVLTGRKHIQQAEEVNDYRNQLLDKLNDLEASKTDVEKLSGKLSVVMDGIPAMVAHVDASQRYIYANRSYARWVGFSQEEITGKSVREVIGEDIYALSRSHIEDALQGKTGELERTVIVAGEARVQHVCFVPHLDERGALSEYFAFIIDITDRKLAEQALLESELRHRTIVQAALDGFLRCDLTGRLLEVNDAYCRMSGYSTQELLTMGIGDLEDFAHPEDTALHLQKIVEHGEDRFEGRHRRKDGSTFSVEVRAQYRPEERYVVAFLRDITETRRKNALNASQLHLVQFALDHSLDELLEETLNEAEKLTDSLIGFYHFVAADQITLSLQNWSTRTKAEFCRADAKGMHYDIDQAGVWVDCVRQRKAVIHNDYEALPHRKGLPEGHAPVMRELAVPVMRGDKITAVLGIGNKANDYTNEDLATVTILADLAWEIVARKRTEVALQESNERFSSAFVNAPTIMAITTLEDGRCIDVNQRFLDFSGFNREEVIGRSLMELGWMTRDERQQLQDELREKGRVSNFELSHRTKTGKNVFLDYSGQLIPIAGEMYLLSIVQDVTEQRIMKQQLFQAQKMEAIGQLAGGIAHDFNNLLQAINTFAFLAQVQLKENGLSVLFAEEIVKAGNRAAELTMGLLAFSRKQTMDPKLTDVNGIIEDTHKLLSRVLDKNIDFSITYHGSPLMVMADTGHIQQVLINLATNARDAMPGGGQLKISTGRAALDDSFIDLHGFGLKGNYAILTVSDSGHGMNGETRAHIFEPFYTTKEQGKGTGLGLSIVYGIVKQHNGFITVESSPSSGTTFHIYLPEVSDLHTAAVDEKSSAPFPGGNETILIVDDEKMVRAALGSILSAYGYKIVEAGDAMSAEETFMTRGGEIQLAVLDIVMPQKNGLETLRQLRAIRPDLPALFITGYADEIAQVNSLLDEHTTLLMKPVEPRQLLETIRQLLAGSGKGGL